MENRKIVLLVESDERFRQDAVQALEQDGYQVIACAASMEALELARAAPRIDILLARVVMPMGNPHGLALGRMLKHEGQRELRIVNYAQLYDDLPEDERRDPPGELYRRPERGAELAAFLRKPG